MLEPNLDSKEVIVVINGRQITGKECFLQSMTTTRTTEEFCKIDLEFVVRNIELSNIIDFDNKKISNKLVKECTVNELLFAVRKLIKWKRNE